MSSTELIENLNQYELVTKGFETLAGNEKEILTLRFGLDDNPPQTLDSVGKIYGVTRERIRQIEAKALGKLRVLAEAEANHEMPSDRDQTAYRLRKGTVPTIRISL